MKVLSLIGILAVLVAAWWIVSPGVFTVHPMGALPQGVTVIYYGRGPEIPFFASPDGLCLQRQGSVSLWCRLGAMLGMAALKDRIIVRLPYSQTAYLWSTGGQTFDR